MDVTLRILRYDPEHDETPHFESYKVSVDPMDRVLDLLIKVKAEQDGSLSFRRSCGHGICGSDAMMINNRNRLACRIRVDQLGKKISVAPLPGLAVVKDLIVEMSGFFGKYRSVKPYLINDSPEPERERRQSQVDRARFDDTTKCILCAACTSSCPRSSRRTVSSSTHATKVRPSGSRSSPTRTASGAAARSSTASTPVRAASTSRGRSSKSPRRSWRFTDD
jgi:succinate dehydrogenase / fumarate reductase iron-sulfur subunit